MADSGPGPAERLAIQWECEKLTRQYALYVDAGDYDRLEQLFAKDAVFARPTDPANPITGRETIMAGFRKRPADRVTRHIVCNTVVDVDDATHAHGRSYMVLYQGPRGAGGEATIMDKPALVGAFDDRFVFEDGAWRFLARTGSLALKSA